MKNFALITFAALGFLVPARAQTVGIALLALEADTLRPLQEKTRAALDRAGAPPSRVALLAYSLEQPGQLDHCLRALQIKPDQLPFAGVVSLDERGLPLKIAQGIENVADADTAATALAARAVQLAPSPGGGGVAHDVSGRWRRAARAGFAAEAASIERAGNAFRATDEFGVVASARYVGPQLLLADWRGGVRGFVASSERIEWENGTVWERVAPLPAGDSLPFRNNPPTIPTVTPPTIPPVVTPPIVTPPTAVRAVLGLWLQTVGPEAKLNGAAVRWVESGGPADGQVFPGDVVIAVGGKPIEVVPDWAQFGASRIGDRVALTLWRGKTEIPLTLTLGTPRPVAQSPIFANGDFSLRSYRGRMTIILDPLLRNATVYLAGSGTTLGVGRLDMSGVGAWGNNGALQMTLAGQAKLLLNTQAGAALGGVINRDGTGSGTLQGTLALNGESGNWTSAPMPVGRWNLR